MSSLLKDLTHHNNLKKYQRVKISLNEKESVLLIPLDQVDVIIEQINAITNISEEALSKIIEENNITLESE